MILFILVVIRFVFRVSCLVFRVLQVSGVGLRFVFCLSASNSQPPASLKTQRTPRDLFIESGGACPFFLFSLYRQSARSKEPTANSFSFDVPCSMLDVHLWSSPDVGCSVSGYKYLTGLTGSTRYK